MIRITPIPTAPAVLTGNDSLAAKERDEAAKHWKANHTMKGFPFKAYKEKKVIEAMENVFHGKCAYCEYRYDAGAPCDVEHYRPKGGIEINGKLHEPGYYWLAAEWTNLLPSCNDCNRMRYHDFPDDGPEARGKANKFPIGNPKKRAKKPADVAGEERLLLHPYFDDPSQYLTFVEKGAIQAVAGPDGEALPMAKASIETYGLDRPGLSHAREDVWVRVAGIVKRAKKDMDKASAHPNDPDAQENLRFSVESLKREVGERAVFQAMVRQLVEPVKDVVK